MKKACNILFGFFILCMVFHLAFSPLHWIKDKELSGYYEKPKDTAFSWSAYFSGAFQDSTEKYLNYKFGLFPGFTRIHHQLEYSLFGSLNVRDVHRGKDGYLMRYCQGCLSDRTFEPHKLNRYLDRYARLKDSVKAAGKTMLWIIAPDKNIVFSEYLPDSVRRNTQTINGYYWDLKKGFAAKKIEVFDFNEQAYRDRDKYPFAVMNKGGVHWTQSYSCRLFDSVCKYLAKTTDISITNTITDRKDRNPWDPDIDIESASNLLFPLEKDNIYFSFIKSVSNAKHKKVLLISDSFGHCWMWNDLFKNNFSPGSEFWYYNREVQDMDRNFKRTLDHKNVRQAIAQFDVFIILYSGANAEQLDYGFVNDVYEK